MDNSLSPGFYEIVAIRHQASAVHFTIDEDQIQTVTAYFSMK